MRKLTITLMGMVVVGLLAGAAQAAVITLDDSAELVSSGKTVDATEMSGLNFDPTGSKKLVVAVSDEDQDDITGITYDGKAMTQAAYLQGGYYYTGIFYLDDPGSAVGSDSSGALVMTGGDGGVGVSLLALSNTLDGVGPTNTSLSETVTLTVLADDSFVVASSDSNSSGLEALDPLIPLQTNANTYSNYAASGYLNGVASGSHSYSFTSVGRATAGATFEAIPEPTSLALLGLGGLALLSGRRRRRS